jgi:hypothetical protein
VRVVQEVPIREILPHASVLIQHSSTTAFEGWLLDRPVIEMALSRFRMASPRESLLGNQRASSIHEVLAILDHYVAGGPIPPELNAVRARFLVDVCGTTDGQASHRCAAAIVDVARRARATRPFDPGSTRDGEIPMTSLDRDAARLMQRFEVVLGSVTSAGRPASVTVELGDR